MWQRFTQRARQVIFFAQEEAARWEESYVSTEHLLLGLVRDEQSFACRVLLRMGVTPELVRSEARSQVTWGSGRSSKEEMQLTPRSKRIIDLAYDEARQMKNTFIGTEHLLLGIIREGEGLAGRVLTKLGVELERTRQEVRDLQDKDPTKSESPQPRNSIDDRMSELFARAFRSLPAEQQAALLGEGLPLNRLDEVPRKLIALMFEVSNRGGNMVLDPQAAVRVNISKADGKAHFTITTPVTFLTNLLVKDLTPPAPLS